MSVKIRPYVNGGWEVDIRFRLPDGTVVRERTKSLLTAKSAVTRWAEARERVLLVEGKARPQPPQAKEEAPRICTLKEFAARFLDGTAKANRLKPSGIASKETIVRVHLIPMLGNRPLNLITTEEVQRLKAALGHRSAKTVNNVLTVLSVMLRTAVEWGVIGRLRATVKLLATPKGTAGFYDFEEYERLVERASSKNGCSASHGPIGRDT
jgi:hypothetical protein